MMGVTVQQLQCFDAVVTEGSFQAAAEKIRSEHPDWWVHAGVLS